MKLQYRGVSYDHNPATLPVGTGKVQGKFRGHKWSSHHLKQAVVLKSSAHLVYRGVEVK